MKVKVDIKFDATVAQRFLIHNGQFVPLDSGGKGSIQVEEKEFDLILFGIEGSGAKGTIKLTPPASHTLEISSHPIEIKVAQGKTRAGGNRFFRVK